MKMPPKSADIEAAVNNLHRDIDQIEQLALHTADRLAQSGIADKRWCAIARTNIEQGVMALHRALRDYPGDDPNQYGKVPLDAPLPKEFQPPTDMPDQYGNDKNIAPPHRQIDWKDYSPGETLDPPDRPDPT